MITITVIIPTYNSEKTIIRALDSVRNQIGIGTIFKFQILICDDCSTDDTIDLCGSYPVNHSFYSLDIVSNEKNSGGANMGRNRGIKLATGTAIALLDHDDEWLPDKTIIQLNELNNGYDFIYSSYIKRVEI